MLTSFFTKIFSHSTLRQKIRLVSWAASVFALLVALGGYGFFYFEEEEEEAMKNHVLLAHVIAESIRDSLYNIDAQAATTILQATQASSSIVLSCLYGQDRKLFAHASKKTSEQEATGAPALHGYIKAKKEFGPDKLSAAFQTCPALLPIIPAPSSKDRELKKYLENKSSQEDVRDLDDNKILSVIPISLEDKNLGALAVVFLLPSALAQFLENAPILFVLFFISLSASLFLADKLQIHVSRPIINLASSMRHIANEKNYSVRVKRTTKDEIGDLIDGFNTMLNEVEARDRELLTGRINLENIVTQRTRELDKVRADIQHSRDFLNQIINSIPDPIIVKDGDLRYVAGNSSFWAMLPGGRETAHNKMDEDFFPLEEAERLYEHDARALLEGKGETTATLTLPEGKRMKFHFKRVCIVGLEKQSLLVTIMRELGCEEQDTCLTAKASLESDLSPRERQVYFTTGHFLVVDDNPISLRVAQDIFHLLGITVDSAASGSETCEKIRDKNYDGIFLDVSLNDMDIFSLVRTCRQITLDKGVSSPFMVGLTGNNKEHIEKGIGAGMDATLAKPLHISSLRAVLVKFFVQKFDA